MLDSLQVLWSYQRAKRRQLFRDRHHLETWQRRKLDRTLKRATQLFPFYKPLRDHPYEAYPITNKKVLLSHFEQMNSLGISLQTAMDLAIKSEQSRDFSPMIGDTAVGLSTGTSGSRLVFLTQRRERLRWAGTILAKALPGSLLTKRRIAFLFRANNNLYSTVQSSRINFRFFDLLQPLDEVLKSLSAFAPDVLIGPSHVLAKIALAKTNALSPTHLISVAEVLEDDARKRIEAAFGTRVHQIYQATEGFLAATCPFGTLHLNEDLLYFERQYLDVEKRRFVPVLTDFYRESQAIIRYRLNDVLIIKDSPCPCGSALSAIEKIEGRCDDVIFLPSKDVHRLKPVFPDVLRGAIGKSRIMFDEFQIIQTKENHLICRIDASAQNSDQAALVVSLAQLFDSLNVCTPEIEIERGTKFDPAKKMRRIERLFQVPEELM